MTPGDRLALDLLCAVDEHVNERGTPATVRHLAVLLRRRSWAPVQRQVRRLVGHGLLWPVVPAGVVRPTQSPWRAPGSVRVRPPVRRRRKQRPRTQRQWYGAGSLTDVDLVAVERALAGEPARPLSIAEKRAAIRIAARRRWNDREIGERIGVTPRHVLRIRRQHGIASGVPLGANQHSPSHGRWGVVA
ncbi:hypothetical protein [Micromonospora sp. RV43]|uniref:hypothetical protein n=1 Tax=Micromonospora sp. RV43 TaxID=1661387 RepID=UPI00064BAD76|nr:hypothetical protein [Micromonospora sp. RV43]